MDEKIKLVINLVNCIIGSCLRIREIHWNTHIQAQHNLTNDIMPELTDEIDQILEIMMGISDRPGFDILKPIIPSSKNLKEILQALVIKIEAVRSMTEEPAYKGLHANLDELTANLNRWIYLSVNS